MHVQSARELSIALTKANYKLVYGGGTKGIMGEVAKTFVSALGPESVEGIIPRALIGLEKPHESTDSSDSAQESGSKEAERTLTSEQLKRVDTNDAIPMSEFGSTLVVQDMHTRKRTMAQRVTSGGPGSGFVALAGGYGTLEEVMEMVTWNQLGIHKVPIVLVNIDVYWDGILDWVKNSIREGFVGTGNANILVEVKDPKDVVDALRSYKVAEGRFRLDWTKE